MPWLLQYPGGEYFDTTTEDAREPEANEATHYNCKEDAQDAARDYADDLMPVFKVSSSGWVLDSVEPNSIVENSQPAFEALELLLRESALNEGLSVDEADELVRTALGACVKGIRLYLEENQR